MDVIFLGCDDHNYEKILGFTRGKIYIVVEHTNSYFITTDSGHQSYVSKDWFKPIWEIRDENIDKLLT